MAANPENPKEVANDDILRAIEQTNQLLAQIAEGSRGKDDKTRGTYEMPDTYEGKYTPQQTFAQLRDFFTIMQNQSTRQRPGEPSQGASMPGGLFGRMYGAAATGFDRLSQWSPRATAYANAINSGIIQPAQRVGAVATSLNQLGEMQGISAAGGDLSIGGMGFRTPFNQAAYTGAKMKFDQLLTSMDAGITFGQAGKIQEMTTGLGYKFGTSAYNNVAGGLESITKMNSLMGQDPRTAELIDRGTRYGQASVSDMVSSLSDLNDTIKNSNVSVAQAMQDAIGYTNLIAKQGGTAAMGVETSGAMQRITGLAGAVTLPLQQNGYVQAMQMKSTGLLPWQLGQMSAGQRAAMTMQSIDQLSRQLGPAPRDTVRTDASGFRHIISGQDKHDATIAQLMGVSVDVIKNMRRNYRRDQKFASLEEGFSGYEQTASRIVRGNLSESEKISRLNRISGYGGKGTFGALQERMKKAGFTQDEIQSVAKAGEGKLDDLQGSAKLAAEIRLRNKKFREIEAKKTQKQTGAANKNKITIDLTNDAKKILKINDEGGLGKAEAGKGIGTVVGTAIGAAIPVGGVLGGGVIGGMIGGAVGGMIGEELE